VVEALVNKKTVMNYPCNEVQGTVRKMWEEVEAVLSVPPLEGKDKGGG
jgi:hypothetical protein